MKIWVNDLSEQSESFVLSYHRQTRANQTDAQLFTLNTRKGLIKVYTPFLFCILIESEVLGVDMEANGPVKVNGLKSFLPHFQCGFIEGKAQFEKDYSLDSKIIYGENLKLIISSFHQLLYHSRLNTQAGIRRGWTFVQNNDPLILTEAELRFFGFYSGMLTGFYDLFNKYPKALEGVEKCDSLVVHKSEAKTKLKVIEQSRFKQVLSYFESLDIEEEVLKDAISGNTIEKRIQWPLLQAQLADLFRRLSENGVIDQNLTAVAKWLNTYFDVEVSGQIQPANESTCYDLLRKHKGTVIPIDKRQLLAEFPELKKRE